MPPLRLDGNQDAEEGANNDLLPHSSVLSVQAEDHPSPSERSESTVQGYNTDEESAEQNDDSCTQIGPGYTYQHTQVRKDNKLGAGPWTIEGMERYNAIVEQVVKYRSTRTVFEGHLKTYFREKYNQTALLVMKRKKRDSNSDEGCSPRKVKVIDLFTGVDD